MPLSRVNRPTKPTTSASVGESEPPSGIGTGRQVLLGEPLDVDPVARSGADHLAPSGADEALALGERA